jgi:hypothetical protein
VVRNPSPVVRAVLALVLLSLATVLGIYKPFGMPYGKRRTPALAWRATYWLYAVVTAIMVLAATLHRLGTGSRTEDLSDAGRQR